MQYPKAKLIGVLLLATASTGALANHRDQDAVIGGLVGAFAGAFVGQQYAGDNGTLTGALVGGLAGAALGAHAGHDRDHADWNDYNSRYEDDRYGYHGNSYAHYDRGAYRRDGRNDDYRYDNDRRWR